MGTLNFRTLGAIFFCVGQGGTRIFLCKPRGEQNFSHMPLGGQKNIGDPRSQTDAPLPVKKMIAPLNENGITYNSYCVVFMEPGSIHINPFDSILKIFTTGTIKMFCSITQEFQGPWSLSITKCPRITFDHLHQNVLMGPTS